MASLPTIESTSSFWHSEPSKFLLGHRTTPHLPSEADVVIVGSGITGASAARYLAEYERAKGWSVVMLDAREACWCATGRNGGHCQPLLFDSTPDVAAFEVRNCNTIKAYIEAHDVPCEWRSLSGCRTFWTEDLAKAVAQDVEQLKRHAPELGKEVTFITDQDELRRKHRVNGAKAATLTACAGSLWPYKLVAFILETLIKGGRLNLQTKTPVTKLEPLSTDTSVTAFGSLPRQMLHTPRGVIRARHVILATNGYTSHLLPEFSDLIVPERGTMTALLPPAGSTRLEDSYGFVGAFGANPVHDDYLNQRPFSDVPNPRGHLMFGGGYAGKKLNMIGETDDRVLDEGATKYLRGALLKLLLWGGDEGLVERVEELEATHEWSGIWGTSRDHHPWVGAVPDREGVWLAGGYSGHGMPNATLCAKAVVEMLLASLPPSSSSSSSSSPSSISSTPNPLPEIQRSLIASGDLPKAYLISKERMQRCEKLDTVQVQDEKGFVGVRSIDRMVRAVREGEGREGREEF